MIDWLTPQSLAALAAGGGFGAMALFTFLVTPLAFRTLGRETAGQLAQAAMVPYFISMAFAAVIGAGLLALAGGFGGEVVVLAAVGFTFIAARQGLLPRMDELRAARAAGDTRAGDDHAAAAFKRLHGISMVVNLAQMLAFLYVALRVAGAP